MHRDRLPPLSEHALTDAQRAAVRGVVSGPRGALVAPFVPLLRSPELMEFAQRMGEYLRYRSAIGVRLTELAILIVAREWDQQVEWAIHAPIALEAGIGQDLIDAIAAGQRPARMADDEAAIYDFCEELNDNRQVADATWALAVELFGEQGVVDLIGINGYYSFLAMVMNAARTPAPPSATAPLPRI